ncbi:MAG: LysR family transcriptional regulator [Deltaproteobacteria bacterium]|nr:MAG: LysR family transcriptional regulator [Deltaproteobacteria bacterium]
MLSIDQLRVLDAIDRCASFAEAAHELHRVPSAVSYAVRQAEEEAGFPIFDRSARKASFTPAGYRLLEEGRRLLRESARLDALAAQLATGWEPELHVVVDGVLPMGPVLRAYPSFADPTVPTRLRVDVEYKQGVLRRFADASADLMLLIGFDPGEDTEAFELFELAPLRMVLVAAPGSGQAPGTGLELAVRDSSPGVDGRSFSGGREVAWLPDFHSKRTALLEGVGFGWLPEHLVTDDLAHGRLAPVEAEVAEWTYAPVVARRASVPLGKGAALFLRHLGVDGVRPEVV